MKNPRAVAARGLRIIFASRSCKPAACAPQRPITRRRPNRPFRDDLRPASGLGGLTVDVIGGACRPLSALIDGEDQ